MSHDSLEFLVDLAVEIVTSMVKTTDHYNSIATGDTAAEPGKRGQLFCNMIGPAEIETSFGSCGLGGLGVIYSLVSKARQKQRAVKMYNSMPVLAKDLLEILLDFSVELVYSLQTVLPPLLHNGANINRPNFLKYVSRMAVAHIKWQEDVENDDFVDARFLLNALFYPRSHDKVETIFGSKDWAMLDLNQDAKVRISSVFEETGIYYEDKFRDPRRSGKHNTLGYRLPTLVDNDDSVKKYWTRNKDPEFRYNFPYGDKKELLRQTVSTRLQYEFRSVQDALANLEEVITQGFNGLEEQLRDLFVSFIASMNEPVGVSRPGMIRHVKHIGSGRFAEVFEVLSGFSSRERFALKEISLKDFIMINLARYTEQERTKPKDYLVRFLRELKIMEQLRTISDANRKHVVILESFWLEGDGKLRGEIERFMAIGKGFEDIPESEGVLGLAERASNTKLCLLMEYCDTNLNEWMSKRNVLERRPFANSFISQIAKGLQALHSLNIVHRDLKCSDIFLVPDPQNCNMWIAKVGDYGQAREYPPSAEEMSDLREAKDFDPFASPEILQHQYLDDFLDKMDVYSLGVIAIHLFIQIEGLVKEEKVQFFTDIRKGCGVLGFHAKMNEANVTKEQATFIERMICWVPQLRPDMAEIIAFFQEEYIPRKRSISV